MAERESQIVLGLDPDPRRLWPEAARASAAAEAAAGGLLAGDGAGEAAGRAVLAHCFALIDAAGPACVAVKAQLARFEVLGRCGRTVLGAVVGHAREAGLLVIADGKRGDIDVSAESYAAAMYGGLETPFGELEGLGADLLTVSALMGRDSVEPFVNAARAAGGGVLVLVRTSNAGARTSRTCDWRAGMPFGSDSPGWWPSSGGSAKGE